LPAGRRDCRTALDFSSCRIAVQSQSGNKVIAEAKLLGQQIEAVFENGVFRPLQPVHLPERHWVTLLLSEPEGGVCVAENGTHAEGADMDRGVGDHALPLQHCQTIRVKFTHTGDFGPIPYAIEDDDLQVSDA
jgi:hypothetical protein